MANARKWKKDEINEYIQSKQISQENYVAPTVQTNYQPSVANTVQAFNSVQPTIKSVESTIQPTQTIKKQQNNNKSFSFSIDNKKEETTEEQRKKKIQEYNEKVAKMNGYDSVKEYDYAKAKEKYEKSSEKVKQYKKEKEYNWFKNIVTGDNENDKKYKKLIEEESKNREAFNKLKVEKNTEKIQKDLEKANPVSSAIARTGIAFGSGATRGFEGIESSVRKITGQEQETDKFNFNEPMLNAVQQGASKGEQIAMNIAQSWGQMTPQMMVPGAKAATALGFLNYGGSAYNDAKRDGATEEQATMYGIASGSTEMLMEKLLGGFENIYGKKMGKDFTGNVMSKLIKNKAVRDTLSGMKGEFTEEYLQEFLEPILKNIILKEDNGADFWNTMKDDLGAGLKQLGGQLFNQQNLVAGLYGAASSGLLQGPMNFANQSVINQQQKPLEQVIRENITQEEQSNTSQLQEQPQISTQTPINMLSNNAQEQNNEILGQQQTPQITPLNQVNQELEETRQNDIEDSIKAFNLEENLDNKTQKTVKNQVDKYGDFSKQIDEVKKGNYPKRDALVVRNDTPKIYQDLGLKNKPITMTQKHLYSITNAKGKYNDVNYHNIDINIIKQLPNALENPLNILKSSTRDDSIVVITELADKFDNPIIASIKIDGEGRINDISIDANVLTSAYGKNDYDNFMKREINNGNLLYDIDEGIKKRIARDRVQFPMQGNSINKNISQNNNNVKSDISNNSNMQKNEKNTINEDKKDEVLVMKNADGKNVELKKNKDNSYEKITTNNSNDILPIEKNETLITSNGDKVSNFYSNITEKSKFITEENRTKMMDNDTLKYYESITNKDTLQDALDNIDKKGAEEVTGDFFTKKEFTPEDVATGWILVKRYQDAGNYEAMSNVIEKMREQGTKAGQTVQMYGILQRLTPEGMEYYSQKQLDNAFKKFSEGKTKQKIDQYAPDFTLTAEEHQFIKDTMEKVQNMTDEEQKKVEIAKIVAMLNQKIPPEKGQRLKAWMRISMLGNPKTQVRNVAGNAIIQPVNWVGDVFSATADKIISKKTGKRTIGTTDFGTLVQGTKKGFKDAVRDAKTGVDTRDINLDRFEENIGANPFYEKHEGKKRILNPAAKVLNKTNKILGNIMSGGDRVFYQAIYDNSLQNQMKLNKVDTPTQEMMDIAEQEALSRTWNDSNSYTKSVLQIRNAMNKLLNVKGYGLGDVLVPFAKTPANLTKAIVDYSPVGLTRTILSDGKKLRNSLENGQYNAQLQHQFADSFGKGVAGSMLWVAAYALAKAGITSGKSDDDKDVSNFMRNTLGIQPYSIKIGDKSFTYDWAQPIAAPFAAMADYQSLTDKEKKDLGSTIEKMTSSASNILLEQSFLSSIQDVFNSYEGPTAAIKQQIQDLPARATPTFFKQIADLIDPTSRQTFVKGDTKETMKNKVQVKIPGKSKELVEQRDTLGREIKKYGGDEDKLKYAFNVFLNPANTNKGKKSEAAEEIYAVYKATGDRTIMPRQVGYSEMISGKSRNLTAKERSEWQKRAGRKVEENVKALSKNPEYKGLSNEDKATVISNIVNYSFSIQKEEMFKAGVSNLYKKAYEAEQDGIPIADFYLEKMENYIDKYR